MFCKLRQWVSGLQQPVSALSHLVGALFAMLGQIILMTISGSHLIEKVSLFIYSASLFCMFLASGIYHLIRSTPKVTTVLRKLDHSAIYILIAGTYTPFCLLAFQGFMRWGLLAIIWGLALTGILIKLWTLQAPRWVTAGLYVAMGWLVVFAFHDIVTVLSPRTLFWLVTGGVIYTLGAVVYATRRMDFIPNIFGFHEVWHIFVLLGAAAHFCAVYSLVQVV